MIQWPDEAKVEGSLIELQYAATARGSDWNFRRSVIDRGGIRWTGRVTIAACEYKDAGAEEAAMVIESFINTLQVPVNTTLVPHRRGLSRLSVGDVISGASVGPDGVLSGVLVDSGGSPVTGAVVGSFVTFTGAGRAYRVIGGGTTDSPNAVRLLPGILPPDTAISPIVGITAHLVPDTDPSANGTDERLGPWTIEWQEAV